MALIARDKGTPTREIPAPGNYIARCVRVIDLGTVVSEWQGKKKEARKVLISWELLGDQKRHDGSPFIASSRYTVSLHEKSGLRKMLESWRGRAFTVAELEGFDLKNVLGKPCMLNVVHEDVAGKTYVNVAAVTPLPAGIVAPSAETQPVSLSLDEDFDEAAFNSLSDGLKEYLASTPEYRALFSAPPADDLGAPGEDVPF